MSYYFFNKLNLLDAVNLWISDNNSALNLYGEINTWNVSSISDFSNLFSNKNSFNSNITWKQVQEAISAICLKMLPHLIGI